MITITPCRTEVSELMERQASQGNIPVARELKPIEELLVKLGQILTKDELHTKSMNMKKVAKLCQKHRIKWSGCTHRATKLEIMARDFFDRHHQILADGVKVNWRTDRTDCGPELRLTFHSFDPANDSYQT